MPEPARRASDRGSIVGWLARPSTNLRVAVLFVSVCVLFGLMAAAFTDLAHRLTNDERSTCAIQARGLPAGHELAATMADIHTLLTLPPTAAQKRQQSQVPPKLLAHELHVLADLNAHLGKYSAAEAKQPETRKCS